MIHAVGYYEDPRRLRVDDLAFEIPYEREKARPHGLRMRQFPFVRILIVLTINRRLFRQDSLTIVRNLGGLS